MSEEIVNEEEDVQAIDVKYIKEEEEEEEEEELSEMTTLQESMMLSKVKSQSKDRHKQVECKVCLRKMRSDTLKRHMLKHRELHTLDEDEMRDELKHRKKLQETKEDRGPLLRQIAEEERISLEDYCDIDTADVLNPISVEKK